MFLFLPTPIWFSPSGLCDHFPQTRSAARLTGRIGALFDQQDKLAERTTGNFKPESLSSYNSSVEVSSLNHVITPSSSLDLKGRLRESGHNIKTSAELIKVLNRIWSLEEQLSSKVSLVKSLKMELHHAHSRIQELKQEQQEYRHEMDDLVKRVSEDRVARKDKERERIKAAIQSIKDELEDEKKLRRRSESLHRKLGKELSEVNSEFKMTLNDLESERRERCLLEDLCDEFAKGLREYEKEIQNLKQKLRKNRDHTLESFDHTLHHISKVWIDERLQMRVAEAHGEEAEKSKILQKLTAEITSFFQARRFYNTKNDGGCKKEGKDNTLQRRSLESVHLNGAVGAPQDVEDDDSVISDLHCFELNMDSKDNVSLGHFKKKDVEGMERLKGKGRTSGRGEKLKYPENAEACDVCSSKQDRSEVCNGHRMNGHRTNLIDSLRGNSSHIGTEEFKIHSDNDHTDSCNHFSVSSHISLTGKANASSSSDLHNLDPQVSHWNREHASVDLDISKFSSKLHQTVKENSLKEKLLEARLEGRNARLRALKVSSVLELQ